MCDKVRSLAPPKLASACDLRVSFGRASGAWAKVGRRSRDELLGKGSNGEGRGPQKARRKSVYRTSGIGGPVRRSTGAIAHPLLCNRHHMFPHRETPIPDLGENVFRDTGTRFTRHHLYWTAELPPRPVCIVGRSVGTRFSVYPK